MLFAPKIADFFPPYAYLALPLGVTLLDIHRDLWHHRFSIGTTRHCLRDDIFSRFDRIPACDKQTDTHRTITHTALAYHRAVKIEGNIFSVRGDYQLFMHDRHMIIMLIHL